MGWYVLTGGPCCGKTTLLREMESRGYDVVEEAARAIIAEEQKKNPNFRTTDDVIGFQMKVMRRQLLQEALLDTSKTYILDHGVPSGIAYIRARNLEVPRELIENSRDRNYKLVLFLEPLGSYMQDEERKESEEEARKIHELTKEVYLELGYALQEIPLASVEERAEMLERIIKSSI